MIKIPLLNQDTPLSNYESIYKCKERCSHYCNKTLLLMWILLGEKMKILHALCGKLLTLVSTRDFIEDSVDVLRQAKQEFRELKAEQHRKEREAAAARWAQHIRLNMILNWISCRNHPCILIVKTWPLCILKNIYNTKPCYNLGFCHPREWPPDW